jgi:hypothetical protein
MSQEQQRDIPNKEASRATKISDISDDRPKRARADDLKKGNKIRLIYTSDPYAAKLRPGDAGIVREIWEDDLKREDGTKIKRIAVRWNNGSNLSLLDGIDAFSKVA